ncbi:MAG: endonuclease III [Acidaminobacteraceae bacterium]
MPRKRSLLNKDEIKIVLEKLLKLYPDAKAELDFENPFELLIATILSAQCTDIRVNIVTKDLFALVKDPKEVVELGVNNLSEIIRTCGLYKSKATNIVKTCEMLEEKYNGEIPESIEELQTLAGVGRKTANVVVSNAFDIPAIAVDTHVFRVSNRLGITKHKDVLGTEIQLMKKIPKELWTKSHHMIIYHGRRVCKARKPLCEECIINTECLYYRNEVGK